jgi:antitoxin component HigA of HigAB toxin-antitoxin module
VRIPAIHPGEHLAEELKELRMSAAELARQLGVPTNRVTEILNGRRMITGDSVPAMNGRCLSECVPSPPMPALAPAFGTRQT